MKVLLSLDGRMASGGSAMVMHCERLVDPLDDFTQAIAAISSKRKKTLPDHEEMSRLEFLGGLYTNPVLTYPLNGGKPKPCLPAWNILRCLQEGAKRHKRGADVLRGIHPLTESVPLKYDGPTSPEAMWKNGSFALRKGVGIQKRKVMRTRPIFHDWQAELLIEVDSKIFDLHALAVVWEDAGTYAGLGDMRPVYGRFAATLKEAK